MAGRCVSTISNRKCDQSHFAVRGVLAEDLMSSVLAQAGAMQLRVHPTNLVLASRWPALRVAAPGRLALRSSLKPVLAAEVHMAVKETAANAKEPASSSENITGAKFKFLTFTSVANVRSKCRCHT